MRPFVRTIYEIDLLRAYDALVTDLLQQIVILRAEQIVILRAERDEARRVLDALKVAPRVYKRDFEKVCIGLADRPCGATFRGTVQATLCDACYTETRKRGAQARYRIPDGGTLMKEPS